MTSLANLRVFATHPHDCSYLEGERATTLFVDPNAHVDRSLYSQLSLIGFRRSGAHLYRPHCEACQACVPARVPVDGFTPNRGQRRVWRRNADVVVGQVDRIDDDEHYRLYCDYIHLRHGDGDMYPPDQQQYESFLGEAWDCTRYLDFRVGGRLVAVAVTDQLDCGLSAIYTFFDATEAGRSLGSYAILYQLELARQLGLPALYLGYWINNCRKMSYKVAYRPIELFQQGRWSRYR